MYQKRIRSYIKNTGNSVPAAVAIKMSKQEKPPGTRMHMQLIEFGQK